MQTRSPEFRPNLDHGGGTIINPSRLAIMPTFTISVVNETFCSSNQHEGATVDAASLEAIKAALQIGTDEVVGGKPFFAAEVKVETANQTVGRFIVSVGASPLQIGD